MNNLFTLIGRITKDLELRYTKEGKPVLDLNLAINNAKNDTTFITTTVFGKVAETTNQYCQKGDLIGVSGIIKNHNWEDKNGNKHYDYTFLANKISFLQTKQKQETGQEQQKSGQEQQEQTDIYAQFGTTITAEEIDESNLGDLPF